MKVKYIAFLLFYIVVNFVYTQNKAIYTFQHKFHDVDKYTDENVRNSIGEFQKIIAESSKNLLYELKFNEEQALFTFKNFQMVLDDKLSYNFFDVGKIYNDFNSGEKIIQKHTYGTNFLISSNYKKYPWKLHKEFKMIGKYKCYLATSKKLLNSYKEIYKFVHAWYCPSIPIQFGPLGYGNLPGLIVELEIQDKGIYTMKEIVFVKKGKNNIKKPTKGKKITENEYNALSKKMYERRKNGM